MNAPDSPITSPTADGPISQPPSEPPMLALLPVADRVRAAFTDLHDSTQSALQDVAVRLTATDGAIRAAICELLAAVEASYTENAELGAGRLMHGLYQVLGHLRDTPAAPITEAELRRRITALPVPGNPLPPLPEIPPIWTPQPTPRAQFDLRPGVPYGVPVSPPPPAWMDDVTSQVAATLPPPGGTWPGQTDVSAGVTPPAGERSRTAVLPRPGDAPGMLTGLTGPDGRPLPDLEYTDAVGMERQYVTNVQNDQVKLPDLSTLLGNVVTGTVNGTQTQTTTQQEQQQVYSTDYVATDPLDNTTGRETTTTQTAAPPSCPPVTVIIKCEGGQVTGARGDGNVIVQGGTGGAGGQGGAGGAGGTLVLDQQFIGAPIIEQQGPPKDDGQLVFEPSTRGGGAAGVWKAIGQYYTDVRSLLADPVSTDSCKDIPAKAKDIQRLIETVYTWLTGTKDGRGWDQSGAVPEVLARLPAPFRQVLEFVARYFITIQRGTFDLAQTVSGCENPAVALPIFLRGLMGAAQTWLGTPFPEGMDRVNQVMGQLCPTGIPTVGETHAAWLAGMINTDTWTCWVRANGARDDTAKVIRDSLRTIPSPLQIVSAGLRQGKKWSAIFDDLREAGVIETRHFAMFQALAAALPSPTDIVSFMVRDVFDETVSRQYGYDDGFQDKFGGKALEWARSQGMEADTFKYYWRAHWRLPSPTQGYEMVHRLRPGRVPKDVETDLTTVRQLLEVNDYPTYWRDRLIAISYRPLTRVDTRRAYFIGALTEEETLEAIKDLGYAEREAKLLLAYWQQERVSWALNQPWAKAYVRGELSDKDLVERLGRLKLTGLQQDQLEQELDLRSESLTRKDALKALRQQLLTGLIDTQDARRILVDMGYRPARADRISAGWELTRISAGKHLSATQLCKLYAAGMLEGSEYTAALLRLGYTIDQVRQIISVCQIDKKAPPDQFGLQRDEGGALVPTPPPNEKAREARRLNLETARAVRKARGIAGQEERVLKKLTMTANALSRAYGGKPDSYSQWITGQHAQLRDEQCYTRQGAADLIYLVVANLARAKDPDWQATAERYFDRLPAQPCPAPDSGAERGPMPREAQ